MTRVIRTFALIVFAVCVGATLPADAAGCPTVIGGYGAVSESEWDLQVTLKEKGRAEVVHIAWLAGEYEKRETARTPATWRLIEGCTIELSYLGIVDRFEYTGDLSLAELGYSGGAPGIRQLKPFASASKIGGVSLWKLPHKFGATR